MQLETPDYLRRFSGVRRLYGEAGFAQLQAMHICVIGIGGVGSWAAEALARNAVGKITLVDLDNIAESNVNRQLHAVEGAFGKAKVSAMHARILSINPACQVTEIEEFITPDNIQQLLDIAVDGIVDCIDDAAAKAALAAFCKTKHIPLVTTGGAGGRLDATQIKTADLAQVQGDKLLAKVRNLLRKDYGYPKGKDGLKQKQTKMGLFCVYSDEAIIKPSASCESDVGVTGLNCAGYGSSVCVTAPFGFAAAGSLLKLLLKI
jgi:tRNA threonylcarbamoyladenosine dehydratase